MTDRAIIRLAQIAHEYDLAGRPREADIIEDAMMRLAEGSAVGNWWSGVKQIGTGLADDAKFWGAALAAPFEAAGAAGNAAWNNGIKNAPTAARQAAAQGFGQADQYALQAARNVGQGAEAAAGPGGTGLPGAGAGQAAVQHGCVAPAGASAT